MLESVYNGLSSFFGKLADSFITILKVLIRSDFSAKLPVRQKPTCSLLGNGPSLRNSLDNQLSFISSTEIFCVNNFATSPEFTRLRPQNYVMLDPSYFYSDPASGRADIRAMFEILLAQTTWPMNLFVPRSARQSYLIKYVVAKNQHITPVFYNYTIGRGFLGLTHWLFRHNLAMPQSQNILAASLFLAINRRYDKVFLFGADHSWHEGIRINESNELLMKQVHFYDKEQDVQHVPVYDIVKKETSRMSAQFASLAKAFYSYEVLKVYADSLGVRVLNASSKSYIDAFERVQISQTVSGPKSR